MAASAGMARAFIAVVGIHEHVEALERLGVAVAQPPPRFCALA
jgi:hypothetical protein